MSGEQVLRALVLKQLKGWSYEELHFELSASFVYQRFGRITMFDKIPTCTTLKRNIKRVKPSTLEGMNALMLEYAKDKKIEAGRRVRVDCTAVESNIHPPTDSSLLWDAVRVLSRLMKASREFVNVPFASHPTSQAAHGSHTARTPRPYA